MNEISNTLKKAKVWVDSNIENSRFISSSIFDKYVLAFNYEKMINQKPTLAVYGESQIGKSYLMSKLFEYNNNFFIQIKGSHNNFNNSIIDNKYIDFLHSINPTGGKESSGIVTRFSDSLSHQNENAPFKVTFLRQIDIAIIIADSYSLDFEADNSNTKYEDIVELLKELNGYNQINPGMSESDVVEFKLYAKKYLLNRNDIVKLINNNDLWEDIINILPKLPWNERYKVLEIFWGKVKVFTQLFNYLSGVLNKISFEQEGNLGLESLIPKKVEDKSGIPVPASIIDVGTVKEIFSKDKLDKRISIYLHNQRIDNFYIGDITAITKELILTVDDRVSNEKPFLKNIDVLDFPGARNRKIFDINSLTKLEEFDSFKIDEEPILHECFVRGKVNYLFNDYNDKLKITTLIYAQKYSNQEVNTLPKQIDNWVVNTHGSNPDERSGKENNLFISFHFFNIELDGKPSEKIGDPSQYDEYWSNRFITNVEKFISSQIRSEDDWINNWSNNQTFKNFFLLRDPNFQKSVIIENGVEKYASEEYKLKHEDMKKSFLSSPIVKKFVKNPEELWDNSASLGKTGAKYIINTTFKVTTNDVKLKQINYRLSKLAKETISLLEPYYQSNDYNKVLEESILKTNILLKKLVLSIQNYNSFGFILDSLNIEEALTWKTFFDIKNPLFNYDKDLEINTYDSGEVDIEVDEFFDFLELDIDDNKENEKEKIKKRKTSAEEFANMLIVNWENSVRRKLENNLEKIDIDNDSFEWLLQILKDTAKRINIEGLISNSVDKYIEQYIGNVDIIYLIARISKNKFNKFINSVGLEYEQTNVDKIKNIINKNILIKSPDIDDIEVLVKNIFDKKTKNKDFYFVGEIFAKEWLYALKEATKKNVQHKFSAGNLVSNPEANNELGNILDALNNKLN